MLIGYSGTLRKGYDIQDLVTLIGDILDTKDGQKAAIIGLGNLGSSILGYFNGKRSKLAITAAFDIDANKTNRVYAGVNCYHIDELAEVIKKENIKMAILTVPAKESMQILDTLIMSGIKGIMNFTPKSLNVPDNIYLEEYDMVTSLEKIAYFIKQNSKEG
jgi:redox-sensing transcriptional repressor